MDTRQVTLPIVTRLRGLECYEGDDAAELIEIMHDLLTQLADAPQGRFEGCIKAVLAKAEGR